MGKNSKIEWTDHTWNPWEGCQKVGPGCDNCYAEARDQRFTGGTHWGPGAPRRRTSAANWAKPIRWNAEAAKTGIRPRVFCASLADVFDNAVDPEWRADLWRLIWATPHLDWLLLTKRPGNIAGMLPSNGMDHPSWMTGWRNVWLGCTVVNQAEADRDIPNLLAVPAKVRFLSVEPMLGPIDLTNMDINGHHAARQLSVIGAYWINALTGKNDDFGRPCPDVPRLDWIICGGESGPNARPMHPDWARSLRDQCVAAGVPFLFKQWGEWFPYGEIDADGNHNTVSKGKRPDFWHDWHDGSVSTKLGKASAGRNLDGRTWDEVPR